MATDIGALAILIREKRATITNPRYALGLIRLRTGDLNNNNIRVATTTHFPELSLFPQCFFSGAPWRKF